MYDNVMEKMRPYQKEAVGFLMKHPRALLADQAGLGKTFTTLMSLLKTGAFPIIVVAIVPALYVWKNELKYWFGIDSTVVWGTPRDRQEAFNEFIEKKHNIIITNYANANEVREMSHEVNRLWRWKSVVCDEIHMSGLLNRKTDTYRIISSFAMEADVLYLVTGTPVRKNPSDLYAPLHLIDPTEFKSYWSFVYDHCIVIKDDFGSQIEGRPLNPLAFREMLKRYMIRRLKKNALPELPPKTRQAIPVMMNLQQAAMYKDLEENMILDLRNYMELPEIARDMVTASNQMVNVLRLRQFLVTPRLLGIDMDGAAMEVMGEMIEDEFTSADRVIIFTPFAEAIPHIEAYLNKKLKHTIILKVHGGMNPRHLDDQVQQFQLEDKEKKVIICTIKSGASITLHAASTEFFLGCEWSLGDNEQAEDRAHRQGQAENVVCYYLLHKGTLTDDRIIEVLNNKTWAVNWCLEPKMMLERSK